MAVSGAALRTAPPATKRSVRHRQELEANSLQEAAVDDPASVEEEECENPIATSNIMKEIQQEIDESGGR